MTDTEIEHLKHELRETKEELVRRERQDGTKGLVTRCPVEFQRLTQLGEAELENHVERLERDIEDLKYANTWPPREYETDTE
ncbi:hypothetical protein [Natronoglomus mannanivorans]|uniref:Uncharacterized protein n=1 Tax=Natronoglomus mannanivorans TaxID=2979990 RepID=A0AAP3E561_9EURY|nr:hypothetical protein [Halobacteria archaeon AArc-xg1-1]